MARPMIDLIVPFHGQYEKVTRCISSIFACTPNQDYLIYLVDDCSINEDYLLSFASVNSKIIPVRTDKHSGFGAALQEGFDAGSSPNVVFMHSDVWVDNISWLANLQRSYNRFKDYGVKLVSARSNNAGTAQSYDPRLIGSREDDIGDVIVSSPLPLHCAFCHRELFSRIGGFVKHYPYAWYEDEELFYRMKYYGFGQGISGASYVNHDGGVTVNNLIENNPHVHGRLDANRELCLEDIRPYIRTMQTIQEQHT